jgi:hypothetical protein
MGCFNTKVFDPKHKLGFPKNESSYISSALNENDNNYVIVTFSVNGKNKSEEITTLKELHTLEKRCKRYNIEGVTTRVQNPINLYIAAAYHGGVHTPLTDP